ncbi:MAG TPA: hypothetical protein VM687_01685 [Stenotrophomonas sp.]|nr:hypothetical protein [Stenotrophomonas sp.]
MKHGLSLLAAGLVLLVGALWIAHPSLALAADASACVAHVTAAMHLAGDCAAIVPAPLALGDGAPGMALIFLIGGLAALVGGIVALRVACPPAHARAGWGSR